VPHPASVLWVENEGPRGKFRRKVRAKLEAWDGPPLEGRLHVLSEPWARFTFADDGMRAELVAIIGDLGIDVVVAGPVARLGAEGGGTPKEIQAFVDLLEQVRADLGRPLAYELIHHENKAGDVSGAWEGATDTLAHVQARGNGHTAVVWRKTRWAPDLHGKTWKLDWRDGERFELDDTPDTTDEAIGDQLLALVRESPGKSWNAYDDLLSGKAKRKRAVRDRLLEDGLLVNNGTAKAMRLFLPEQTALFEKESLDEEIPF
jgi:AAA domain